MRKIYISADIEGVCGITDWDEAAKAHSDYAELRARMTAEVSAASEAALEAGATEILVKDSHASGRNLLAEELPERVRLVRGWSGHPFSMVQELDESFDAAMFVGWHSAAGSGGNPLAHTLSSSTIAEMLVNGEPASEFLLHAYAAALVSVPVVFVSGDAELCDEVRALNESIGTFAVSRGHGASTISLHPLEARAGIRKGVQEALRGDRDACKLELPASFSIAIRYKDQRKAYKSSFYPGARLETPAVVTFEADDWFEVLRLLKFVI